MARTLTHWFGAMLLLPALAHAEIEQRQVVTAIKATPDGDVLTLANDSGCGGKQVLMHAVSVRLDEDQYLAMKQQLAPLIRDKTPLLMRIKSCPAPGKVGGEAGALTMPEVGKLGGCEPQACLDAKARLYLNHNLTRGEVKEQARYALLLPLPPGKIPGTWQVEIHHVREGEPKRLTGQVNAPDYLRGKLVGNYSMYYPHGQLEMQVERDGRSLQEGVQTLYYPDGKVSMRNTWRNGVQEGEEQSSQQSGKLNASRTDRNGTRADSLVETFDQDGKLRTRMTQVKGQTEGELLLFYPDGKVESRSQYVNGIQTGPSTSYFPDGKVHRTGSYVDGKPAGESVEYYPDGKVASKRTHSGQYVIRAIA